MLENVSHSNFIRDIKSTIDEVKKKFDEKGKLVDNIK